MEIRESPFIKNLPHIIGIAILILVLLFTLVNFGYLRCCDIPGFCDIYYGIKGYPKIAIVFGEDGIGDPEALRNVIVDRKHQFADMIPIENLVSSGLLDKYALVIVERAKTIETPTFYVFRDYVQKGGKLLWIGDAGTGLVKGKDYVCEKITFTYLPSVNATIGQGKYTGNVITPDGKVKPASELEGFPRDPGATLPAGYAWETKVEATSQAQCAPEWVEESPNDPKDLKGGICGANFGEIVVNYVKAKQEINDTMKLAGESLCPTQKDAFKIEGAEKEQKCLDYLYQYKRITEDKVTVTDVNTNCVYSPEFPYGFSNWKRGPSETLTGAKLEAIDFGSTVLGLDYVSSEYADEKSTVNLFLQPTDVSHRLVRGYEARTQWFGTAYFSITDISRYTLRTASVMNLIYRSKVWPAVCVSSPVGPLLTKTGLVIYYAFPPEIGATPEATAPGTQVGGQMTGKILDIENQIYEVYEIGIKPKASDVGYFTGWKWSDSTYTRLETPEDALHADRSLQYSYAVEEVDIYPGYRWWIAAETVKEARGMGLNLIDNLIDFTLCK